MDAEFASALEKALVGSRFTVDALCERIRAVPECAAYAADLCALMEKQEL